MLYHQFLRKVSWFLFGVVALMVVSCSSDEVINEEEPMSSTTDILPLTNKQFETSEMEFGTFSKEAFRSVIRATGRLDVPPEYRSTVSAYFGGYVKQISLLEGQKVKKGQVLFTLESPDYIETQQDFLEAQSMLSYLKSDFERQKELAEDNISSQKTVSKAESDYKVMRARFESLKRKLQLMNINPSSVTESKMRSTIAVTAPISGYVTSVKATKGLFLNPSDVALTLTNTEHTHVELSVFEQDLHKVEKGQSLTFSLQNDPKNYMAEVYMINKAIDLEEKTIKVHCHLLDGEMSTQFIPGRYVEAEISSSLDSSLALPTSAVIQMEDKYFILLKKSKSSEGFELIQKEVKIGVSNANHVQILTEFRSLENAEVLIKGAFNLINP